MQMGKTKVKVCGLTREEEANACGLPGGICGNGIVFPKKQTQCHLTAGRTNPCGTQKIRCIKERCRDGVPDKGTGRTDYAAGI